MTVYRFKSTAPRPPANASTPAPTPQPTRPSTGCWLCSKVRAAGRAMTTVIRRR